MAEILLNLIAFEIRDYFNDFACPYILIHIRVSVSCEVNAHLLLLIRHLFRIFLLVVHFYKHGLPRPPVTILTAFRAALGRMYDLDLCLDPAIEYWLQQLVLTFSVQVRPLSQLVLLLLNVAFLPELVLEVLHIQMYPLAGL